MMWHTISLVKTTLKLVLPIALLTTIPLFICAPNLRALSADCIDLQPGDTPDFGDALVANDRFLAIGYAQANRIAVYRRTSQRQWDRVRTIALPPNPQIANPSSRPGYGVTYKLAISGDKLVIGKVVSIMRSGSQEAASFPYQPPAENGMAYVGGTAYVGGLAFVGAVYRTSVAANSPLERIDRPKDKELAGFSVAADGGKIAFSVATYDRQSPGYITVISGDRRYSLAASGEVALKKNLLVAGSTTSGRQGKLAVFNLADATPSPRTIAIPIPVRQLAIADKYIVVAEQLEVNQFPRQNPHLAMFPKTLFANIADLAITSVDGFGEISTYGNKLVRSYSSTDDNESIGKIELFNLGTMPPKSLSSRSGNIRRSFLTNDYLFTIELQNSSTAICVAPSSK
jgi:hypothetical protein